MDNDVYDKLLNECSKEYKMLLKEYLTRNNLKSISDVVKVDSKIKRVFLSDKINHRKIAFILIELYTMMLIAILFTIGNYTMNEYIVLTSILIISALELLMTSKFINILRYKKENKKTINENKYIINYYNTVSAWRKIEAISNDIKIKNEKAYINNIRTIEFLKNNRIINHEESLALKKLLEYRNKIAHSNYVDEDYNVDELMEIANRVIERLEKIRG